MGIVSPRETQNMVEASGEGHIDRYFEDLPRQKRDSVQPYEVMGGVQFVEAAVGSLQTMCLLLGYGVIILKGNQNNYESFLRICNINL